MNYRLKNTNGKVTFLLRTGKDLVKNQMAIASAQHIIDNGKLLKSDIDGYPILTTGGISRGNSPSGRFQTKVMSKRRTRNENLLF